MNDEEQRHDDDLHTAPSPSEEKLWDPQAGSDPDVEKLERLLAPMGFDPEKDPWRHRGSATSHPRSSRPGPWWRLLTLGAVAAAVLIGLTLYLQQLSTAQELPLTTGSGQRLQARSVYVAKEDGERLLLGEDGRLADLELSAGSRLAVRSLSRERTILDLQRGEMDAFVSAEAKPGFFNVDTPATRCVDLGCQYRLTVDGQGKAHVEVLLGRVAFRDARKVWRHEVFVPHGAICTADPKRGSSTPRYADMDPGLAKLLDGYDALETDQAESRRHLATTFIARAERKEDMLPVWHFLEDPDATISTRAADKLRTDYGRLPGFRSQPGTMPDAEERALWREHLWPDPYK